MRTEISQHSTFCKRDCFSTGDDDVIKHGDIDQRQRFFEPVRNEFVRLARFGRTRWMRMSQHQSSGVTSKGQLHHLPGMYAGSIDRAAKQLYVFDEPMARVEQ